MSGFRRWFRAPSGGTITGCLRPSAPRSAPDAAAERLITPAFFADPYPAHARVREEGRVYFSPARHHSFLMCRAEVETVLRDPSFLVRPLPAAMAMRTPATRAEMCPHVEVASRQMLFVEPPDHSRLRGPVSRAFTSLTVERMRPRVEAIADQLLRRIARSGSMDGIGDLAYPVGWRTNRATTNHWGPRLD